MRTTPALALVAAFLASSAVGALSLPQAGLESASGAKPHRRACRADDHHKRHHDDSSSAPKPWNAPVEDIGVASPQPLTTSDGNQQKDDASAATQSYGAPAPVDDSAQAPKVHKKKGKKCALKHKGQGAGTQPPQTGGDLPPVPDIPGSGQSGDAGQGVPANNGGGADTGSAQPGNNGADQGSKPEGDSNAEGDSNGQQPAPGTGDGLGFGDDGAGDQPAPNRAGQGQQEGGSAPPIDGGADQSSGPKGYSPDQQPNNGQDQSGSGGSDGSSDQSDGQDTSAPTSGSSSSSSGKKYSGSQGKGLACKGMRGSTTLPRNGTVKPDWFQPDLIHHGQGTQFGGPGLWQGGACMYDDMPHKNLPSVAMDQTFYQDGLACGTCVEIASTDASKFDPNAHFQLEQPKKGTLPAGKKTVAIVSDLCPGVDQCWSGLDMHLDAWNSVAHNASGTKLPINWRFVNCKQAFEGSGIEKLQLHWRSGASPGFFQVQIRGSHEAVVRVEMKFGGKGWLEASHLDHSYWKFDLKGDTQTFDQKNTGVTFRITDWQGETITSEVTTVMGQDLFFDANFDRIS